MFQGKFVVVEALRKKQKFSHSDQSENGSFSPLGWSFPRLSSPIELTFSVYSEACESFWTSETINQSVDHLTHYQEQRIKFGNWLTSHEDNHINFEEFWTKKVFDREQHRWDNVRGHQQATNDNRVKRETVLASDWSIWGAELNFSNLWEWNWKAAWQWTPHYITYKTLNWSHYENGVGRGNEARVARVHNGFCDFSSCTQQKWCRIRQKTVSKLALKYRFQKFFTLLNKF